jgi:three-Cys-motif partner protein
VVEIKGIEEEDDFELDGDGEHSHADACLWPLNPHTEAKHRLYKRYISAWAPILLQESWVHKITYLEGFAGPGEYATGQDGSPAYAIRSLLQHERRDAMRLSRDRVTMIFLEKNAARCEHLKWRLEEEFGELRQLPIKVEVEQGRAEQDTIGALTRHDAWGDPILGIFDSFGSVRVPHTTIREIARNKASEVIVTFGPIWFSRREAINQSIFDEVFGSREAWLRGGGPTGADEGWRYWLSVYQQALLDAGFDYSLQFGILPVSGHPLYLVYGTKSEKGVLEFKNAMWNVDKADGMHFNDPRTNAARQAQLEQMWPSLFDDDPDVAPTELRGFVLDLLEQGPRSVAAIGDYLLTDTARWRPRDATWAAKQLLADGMVTRTPKDGQLTKQTVLSLHGRPETLGTAAEG